MVLQVTTLLNGVVSMKDLQLSTAVGSKERNHYALPLFKTKLSWGQSFALITLVMCGKEHPVEKARDMETCRKIMYSVQPYALSEDSEEQLHVLTEAEPEPRQAYLHCMAKAAQQKLRMHCMAKSAIISMKRY